MKREPGYYWVKVKGQNWWDAVRWSEANNGYWDYLGNCLKDYFFSEINETRILSPDEAKLLESGYSQNEVNQLISYRNSVKS